LNLPLSSNLRQEYSSQTHTRYHKSIPSSSLRRSSSCSSLRRSTLLHTAQRRHFPNPKLIEEFIEDMLHSKLFIYVDSTVFFHSSGDFDFVYVDSTVFFQSSDDFVYVNSLSSSYPVVTSPTKTVSEKDKPHSATSTTLSKYESPKHKTTTKVIITAVKSSGEDKDLLFINLMNSHTIL